MYVQSRIIASTVRECQNLAKNVDFLFPSIVLEAIYAGMYGRAPKKTLLGGSSPCDRTDSRVVDVVHQPERRRDRQGTHES